MLTEQPHLVQWVLDVLGGLGFKIAKRPWKVDLIHLQSLKPRHPDMDVYSYRSAAYNPGWNLIWIEGGCSTEILVHELVHQCDARVGTLESLNRYEEAYNNFGSVGEYNNLPEEQLAITVSFAWRIGLTVKEAVWALERKSDALLEAALEYTRSGYNQGRISFGTPWQKFAEAQYGLICTEEINLDYCVIPS